MEANFTQEQVKSAAIAQLSSAGALAPDQLYRLVQENLRAKDGQPVAVVGGVEVPVGEYIANLKNPGSGYEHHFAATNRAGMGVTGSARATALPGQTNPWSTRQLERHPTNDDAVGRSRQGPVAEGRSR